MSQSFEKLQKENPGLRWHEVPFANIGNLTLQPGQVITGLTDMRQFNTVEDRMLRSLFFPAGDPNADSIPPVNPNIQTERLTNYARPSGKSGGVMRQGLCIIVPALQAFQRGPLAKVADRLGPDQARTIICAAQLFKGGAPTNEFLGTWASYYLPPRIKSDKNIPEISRIQTEKRRNTFTLPSLGRPDGRKYQTVSVDDLAALTVAHALDQAKS